jgi:hypothetical protein
MNFSSARSALATPLNELDEVQPVGKAVARYRRRTLQFATRVLDAPRDNLLDLDAISVESFRQGNDGATSLNGLRHQSLLLFIVAVTASPFLAAGRRKKESDWGYTACLRTRGPSVWT